MTLDAGDWLIRSEWSRSTSAAFDRLMSAQPDGVATWTPAGTVVAELRCHRRRHLVANMYRVPEGLLLVSRRRSTHPPQLRRLVEAGQAPEFLNDGVTDFWAPGPDLLTAAPGVEFVELTRSLNCRCGTVPRPSRSDLLDHATAAASGRAPRVLVVSIREHDAPGG